MEFRTAVGSCMAVAALMFPAPSWSQSTAAYPSKPVKLVVSVAPGGLSDLLARLLGQGLQERLGQPVVVENKPGAAGLVAMEYVAKAPADGYTLGLGYPGALAVNQSLYKSLPYDPVKDFSPVSLVAAWPLVLVAHPSVPAQDARELIALLRAEPGRYSYASGGNATTGHLAMELLKSMTRTDVIHIPYRGAGPAMTDLIAGRVQLEFDSLASAMPQVKAGKIKALAISTAKPSFLAPELQTVAEGGAPGFDVTGWYGIVAPAGTPPKIVRRLSDELVALVREPGIKAELTAKGMEPIGQGSDQFEAFVAAEARKWGALVRERHITVD